MSTVSGGVSPNISITQVGQLGLDPGANIPAGVMGLRGFFQSGTLAEQFSLIHSKTYLFAASTPQTINLQGLLDIVGASISLSLVRFFACRIQATNSAYIITAGGAGTNEWNGYLTSGSKEIWYPSTANLDGYTIRQAPSLTGIPVTSSSRLLKLDPGSNAVGNVDIIIAGS